MAECLMAKERAFHLQCGLRYDDPRHWRNCVAKRDWPAWMLVPKQRSDAVATLKAAAALLEELEQEPEEITVGTGVQLTEEAGHRQSSSTLPTNGEATIAPAVTPASEIGVCCQHAFSLHIPADGTIEAVCMACPDGQDAHAFKAANEAPGLTCVTCSEAFPTYQALNAHLPTHIVSRETPAYIECDCGYVAKSQQALRLHRMKSSLHREVSVG